VTRRTNPLLVDTNVILEAHRTSTWKALAGGYGVETVEACVVETQTGFQQRRPELQIDEKELRAKLREVHDVTKMQRAGVLVKSQGISLDPGELDLWAHAIEREDAWILCGPDIASLRFGIRAGFRDRLISLESLLQGVGLTAKGIRANYSEEWLKKKLIQLVATERGFL
jgi:hypothetical protein